MLELLLPDSVSWAERRWDPAAGSAPAPAPGERFHPEEAALGERSVARRRAELLLGRACAHSALAALGGPDVPIGKGAQGEPLWPAGYTGSITHCAGYCAAAVARRAEVAALGIDAEPNEPISERMLARIADERERAHVAELLGAGPTCASAVRFDRLLFCVKEALYKALFARSGARVPFAGSRVRFALCPDRRSGRFDARLASGLLAGRWCLQEGILGAALLLGDAR